MFRKILNFLFGGNNTIEKIASEWIQTDMEKAEARTLMVKTLDPNGLMRRDISRTVCRLYVVYIICCLILIFCQSFGLGSNTIIMGLENKSSITVALENIVELFIPITTLFGTIVSASFGVNFYNVKQGK